MEACSRGDDLTVLTLIRLGASLDVRVPSSHPSCAGWTSLCFATANNHYTVAKVSILTNNVDHHPLLNLLTNQLKYMYVIGRLKNYVTTLG